MYICIHVLSHQCKYVSTYREGQCAISNPGMFNQYGVLVLISASTYVVHRRTCRPHGGMSRPPDFEIYAMDRCMLV